MAKDYYKILGVSKDAPTDKIKSAYRKLAQKYHPDMNPNNKSESEERFKEISEAYDALIDPDKRAAYNRYGSDFAQRQYGTSGFDMGDFVRTHQTDLGDLFNDLFEGRLGNLFGGGGPIFEQFFGGETTRTRGRYVTRGGDIKVRVSLSLKEIYTGVEKKIHLARMESCETCQGRGGKGSKTCSVCEGRGRVQQIQRTVFGQFSTVSTCANCGGTGKVIEEPCLACNSTGVEKKRATIKVKIPAGVQNGNYLSLRGQGNAGEHRGPKGDLIVVVEEKPDHLFTREGNDIYIRVPVPYPVAVLGGRIKVKTLAGDVILKIPSGTQSRQVFNLRGRGMPKLSGYGRGNQLTEVFIDVPKKPSREERELIGKLLKVSSK